MMAKETTLQELGNMISHIVGNMATKDDISGIMAELVEIKSRLKALEDSVDDHAGHAKEIDHALERIAAIEQHLDMKSKAAT